MNLRKSALILLTLVVAISLVFAGCSSNATKTEPEKTGPAKTEAPQKEEPKKEEISGSIVSLGSTAMQPLVEEAAKQFMSKNPKAQIQVQGGGSGTGLSQVSSGGANIGNSDVFAEEKIKEKEVVASLVDHKIAVVGMAAVAHKDVGVDNLTKQQLIDIFTGKITNWKDVGGKDLKITLVNRPKSSGTRATFKKYALDGAEEAEGITEESSGTVRKIISETPGAIGYLAFSYFDDSVKPLKLDGVEPTEENVITGKFPIWAYQHSYTKGKPEGLTKAFLDFMMSAEVQETIIPKLGYISATKMKVERDASGKITNK
ncbi:MAG: phosphate transport system substrate-binding protein [Petroclostridium sp.]|jgi:phosphate transport system substrate-binding protein|uniref:phosphate ABC transporter substrate-binding protein n=1 Tax=Petroclostridium xylanilyticum TaxID=1792311 RepID=UPI000B98DA91|nr:phosphate ABC transporter substrate-binding protein [Petroclostridium xylanilyticum]MBZ4645725.1 pstS1 [Clostridia bacterium]MDK2809683.1 phosphate transport system substrate-binding protein [Petroclostridium sp.]